MSVRFINATVTGTVSIGNVAGSPAKLSAPGVLPGDVLQGGSYRQQLIGISAFWQTSPATNPDGTWPDIVITEADTLDAYFQSNDFGAPFAVSTSLPLARETIPQREVTITASVDGEPALGSPLTFNV